MLTLGIVNTYDRIKVIDAHYRAIARAAPICYAFGFSLALFDFPFKMERDELVEYIMDKTTIGESGKYLDMLNQKNHFFVFDLPKKGFQSQFGQVVATTSKPDPRFAASPEQIADGIRDRQSYLFLVGLGRKGLPKQTFSLAKYHLDLTSAGVSFETCTAIGAIPAHLMGLVSGRMNNEYTNR
ncbi:MAG: DUF531 domain-containing protein [Methanosarcinaceae archaeon]|nr:DUF531 domain-containing protein [Methanosarcinaceae archaeon]